MPQCSSSPSLLPAVQFKCPLKVLHGFVVLPPQTVVIACRWMVCIQVTQKDPNMGGSDTKEVAPDPLGSPIAQQVSGLYLSIVLARCAW